MLKEDGIAGLGLTGDESATLEPVTKPENSDPFGDLDDSSNQFDLGPPSASTFADLSLDGQNPFGDLDDDPFGDFGNLVTLMSDAEL